MGTASLAAPYGPSSPWNRSEMPTSRNRSPDSFEEPLSIAHKLMRKKKGAEACDYLLQAQSQAVSRGMTEDAALYASVRGSYLMAMGQNEDALGAYRAAERLSGNDPHYQLSTARHLVGAMGRPSQALEATNAAVSFQSDDPAVSDSQVAAIQAEALSIRGLAFLGLGQPEKAVQELEALLSTLSSSGLPALSCDLTLVEEVSRHCLAPNLVQRYLELVEARARAEKESRVLERVLAVKQGASTSNPPQGSSS